MDDFLEKGSYLYLGGHYGNSISLLHKAFESNVRLYVSDQESPQSFVAVQDTIDKAHQMANSSGKNHIVVITNCTFSGFHARKTPYPKGAAFMGMRFPRNVSLAIGYCQMSG